MQIAEGDMVATRWEFSGTNTGAYTGRPPTGRTVTRTGVQIERIEASGTAAGGIGAGGIGGGKIAESCVDWDMHRQFKGVGIV